MADGASPQFSDSLRQLREAAGLTQEALAERAGISVKAISALERGRRQRPYPHTIRALAEALGLSEAARAELAGTVPGRERKPAGAATAQSLSPLPLPPRPLIGRERELAAVVGLVQAGEHRMITLTGAGGVGKTRLALEAAVRLRESYPGEVAFVPLAPLAEARLVLPAIALALGLTETGATPVRSLLVTHLGSRRWLLVLDNVEHLLDAVPELSDLLAACPGLTLLVTSRAPLNVRAEQEYPVHPLALPDVAVSPPLDEVAAVSSVRLFLARAQGVRPDFRLTQDNCAAVAAICRRLDGLPLALELVATRIRLLSPGELLARLDRVLPILIDGPRDLPERQQTMRAAIDWSYALLNPREQALFRRLSVFAGGWTLETAEAVTAWGNIAKDDVVSLFARLVEQSLVVATTAEGRSGRYWMLVPIREFAAECLEQAGERVAGFEAHLAWCLALAQRSAPRLRGPDQQQWLDRLDEEHDNLRVALAWSVEHPSRVTDGLRLATALWRFWETRGYLSEGRSQIEQALAVGDAAPDTVRAEALNAAGNLARDQGAYPQAIRWHAESLTLRRELGDTLGVAQSLNNLGIVLSDQGDYTLAMKHYEDALSLFRVAGSDLDVALSLHNMGILQGNRGEYQRATGLLKEALELWDRVGEISMRARALDALGEVARLAGDLDRALRHHQASLDLRREIGDTRGIAITLNNLGMVARYQHRLTDAEQLIEESLRICRIMGARSHLAISLAALAGVAWKRGDMPRARSLYVEAIGIRQELDSREGIAECLLGLAAIASASGHAPQAARELGASDALRTELDQQVPPIDRPDYDRTVATIRASMAPDAFAAAYADGQARALPEAIVAAIATTQPTATSAESGKR